MKKSLPLFRRIALFCCILTSSVACEKFDDTDRNNINGLPKPLPDMILYTTSDGNPVGVVNNWKEFILDNCYYEGMGRIIFKENITEIPSAAFWGSWKLENVALPENINIIGANAFRSTGIRSIVIPNKVKSLEARAFASCSNLKEITVPNSVVSIGEEVFASCTNLKSIKLPVLTTEIPPNAFYYCENLRSITIPEYVYEIGNYAFYHCSSLKKLSIPKRVEKIGRNAFSGCTSLEQINIPSNVRSIGTGAFLGCEKLKTISLPEGIETITSCLFSGCSELSEIKIPESVTSIEFGAFQNTKIAHIHIPDNIYNIRNGAFCNMSYLQSFSGKFVTDDGRCVITDDNILKGFAGCGLTSYEFPESIREIVDFSAANYDVESLTLPSSIEVFSFITYGTDLTLFQQLKTIYCKATVPPTSDFYIHGNEQPSVKVYVPRASVEAYKQDSNWSKLTIEGYDF